MMQPPADNLVSESTDDKSPRAAAGGATVDLSKFDNSWYRPGGKTRRLLWYVCNAVFVNSSVPYPSSFKSALLRLFGAKVGRGVVIKPNVNIKFPWFLELGDHVWLGEGAWIDNLTHVRVGSHVCLSQGAYVLTGNHDYKRVAFDLLVSPVVIEDGVWVGAKAVVCPGTTLRTHAVVTAGSVISRDVKAWTIYSGNLATPVRARVIRA
jgi:putative colanic acid biosynthesis acetyltransferase WcaF